MILGRAINGPMPGSGETFDKLSGPLVHTDFPWKQGTKGLVHTDFPWNSYGPMAPKSLWKLWSTQASVRRVLLSDYNSVRCRLPSSQKQLRARKKNLSVALRKRKRKEVSGNLHFVLVLVCCCGLCVPHMFISKANSKKKVLDNWFAFPLRKQQEQIPRDFHLFGLDFCWRAVYFSFCADGFFLRIFRWIRLSFLCGKSAQKVLHVARPRLGPFFVLKFVRSRGFEARFLQPFPKPLVTVKYY